ncbi:MAG: twitching motility protein PilT [Planctomycetota bacterium]|nr:MAG: twitching motility protein PilT [Planctomycetota bacterium]
MASVPEQGEPRAEPVAAPVAGAGAELAGAAPAPGASLPAGPAEAGAEGGPGPELERLLRFLGRCGGTDLHLKAGSPPLVRIDGVLRPLEAAALGAPEVERLLAGLLGPARRRRLAAEGDVDLALSLPGVGRFRLHIFRQRGAVSAAVRRVRTELPSFEELHLPRPLFERLARLGRGLVLVCGTTGAGKSTTLAALLGHLLATRRCHVVTIEDPIEYLFRDGKGIVNQREVGIDVPDFARALRAVMREDPDVILIGEMRDADTFEAALAAAETGHLVLATMHSATVAATIGRILELFPAERERQVRSALRFHLRAVVCQKILPAVREGVRRVPALEVLLVDAAAQKAIAEGADDKLEAIVRGGREHGMVDFNTSLLELVRAGMVEPRTALAASPNPEQLELNLKGIFLSDDRRIL